MYGHTDPNYIKASLLTRKHTKAKLQITTTMDKGLDSDKLF